MTSDGPQSPPPSPFTSFPRPLSGQETEYSLNNLLPNAEQVSVKEKFILPYKSAFAVPLDLEPNIDKVWSLLSKRDASLQQLMSDCLSYRDGNSNASAPNINADGNNKNNNYRILILPSSSLNTPASVTLWYFDQGVDTRTILRGFYHACIIRSFLETCPNYLDGLVRSSLHLQIDKLLEWSASCVQDTFSQLATRALQDGWDLDHTHLSEGENGRIEIEI